MTEKLVDVGRGMVLVLTLKGGERRLISLRMIADSETVVKTVNPGDVLWGDIKEKKIVRLRGMKFENIESAQFVRVQDRGYRGQWHFEKENECERFWIESGIDSTTHRVFFRIEKCGDNDIIVYAFLLV